MLFGKYINKYYVKYAWLLLLGVLALLAVDYFQLKIPELYGAIVDGLDPTTEAKITLPMIGDLCLQMLGVIAVLAVGRFLWRICFFGSAIRVETDLRENMFNHCKDLSQQFYQKNKVGDMMAYFTNDIETINECFGDGVMMFVDALVLGAMALVKMLKINVFLTLLSLVPLILMCAMSVVVGKYMTKKWTLRQEAYSKLSDFTQETFSGIAVIKAFVKETKELLAFKKINKYNEETNVSFTKFSTLTHVLTSLFIQSIVCIILGVGGYYAYLGRLSSAQLIMFLSFFNSLIWPVMAVAYLIEMTARGKASLNRIGWLLDTEVDVKDGTQVRDDVQKLKGKIQFKDLTFRYPDGENDCLHNVSFTIEQGERVGIIGHTGSGKSTLVDLLLRMYNIPDGCLFIDDYDVNTLPIRLVREHIAYVPQDNFLFSETIEKNIAFAYEGHADMADIVRVSRLADLDDNVSDFADGYQTMLGERGVTISGGQKQRTSIARALLKDAEILILDDSVSAVDTKTERKILDNLQKERQGKTTILIAHRVTTVQQMDKIAFMVDGSVIDFGTHDELYARCAEYKKTVDLQKLEDEEGGEVA